MTTPPTPSLAERLVRVWVTYIKGQFVLAIIIGGLTWLVSAGLGLRWALALGAVAGVFEAVPSIGPIIAVIPAVIVALWQGSSVVPVENWVFALIVLGVYILIQQVGALIIEPRVLGERLHLPPLLVFLGVLAGAALGGIVGALLAVPLIASVREVIDYWQGRPPIS